MRNFIVGSASPQTQLFLLNSLLEQPRSESTVGSPPSAKIIGVSAPPNAPKITDQVFPPRSSLRDSRVGRSLYVLRKKTPPSIDLATQKILVDPLTPHDNSERTKQNIPSVPPSQLPSAPAAATSVPRYRDCPRIDLVTLVRENQMAKKLQKKKLTAPPPQKERRRCVIPQGSGYEKSR